jgi:hypothetical protein
MSRPKLFKPSRRRAGTHITGDYRNARRSGIGRLTYVGASRPVR